MFEALSCAMHNKPAERGEAHLVITQAAPPYNKGMRVFAWEAVYNVQRRTFCKEAQQLPNTDP